MPKLHTAFGCYGVITTADSLVVIAKNGGPYRNRYDLPGGSLDGPEPPDHCVIREVKEETGLTTSIVRQYGATSFVYPWTSHQWDLNQHLCVFYQLAVTTGELKAHTVQFIGQDSLGARLLPFTELSLTNASPLVMWAVTTVQTGHADLHTIKYPHWAVLPTPVW